MQQYIADCYLLTFNYIIFFVVVIGKGGEQITRLQAETGCKVQIAPGILSDTLIYQVSVCFNVLKHTPYGV